MWANRPAVFDDALKMDYSYLTRKHEQRQKAIAAKTRLSIEDTETS